MHRRWRGRREARRHHAALASLEDNAPANQIATDHLGRFRDPPRRARELTARLLALLEHPQLANAFQHDLLLALFHRYRRERAIPAEVTAEFDRDARHPAPAVRDFAAWAHEALRVGR